MWKASLRAPIRELPHATGSAPPVTATAYAAPVAAAVCVRAAPPLTSFVQSSTLPESSLSASASLSGAATLNGSSSLGGPLGNGSTAGGLCAVCSKVSGILRLHDC